MSEPDFVAFLQGAHQKLGAFQSSEEGSKTFVYRNERSAQVMLRYDCTFARGPASERFTWQITDDQISLENYKIEAAALAANGF